MAADQRNGGLEEAMKKLNLSSVERKGIKLGKQAASGAKEEVWHAIGRVLAEKPISAEGIQQTLGRIWCQDRGLTCKEMGDNVFLFHFNHPMGARRALEDGPCMAGHNLLVMVAYDGSRALEAVEFNHVPMWIRVSGLSMGMMNREVAQIIGEEVGQFLDVDAEENGTAAGRYLRIKVRYDIRQPLRRGLMIEVEGEGDEQRWCPIEYEFLPEFCYNCGVIGHLDRNCLIQGEEGVPKQYGRWLRVTPARRRFSDEARPRGLPVLSRSSGDWRRDKEERQLVKVKEREKDKGTTLERSTPVEANQVRSEPALVRSVAEVSSGEGQATNGEMKKGTYKKRPKEGVRSTGQVIGPDNRVAGKKRVGREEEEGVEEEMLWKKGRKEGDPMEVQEVRDNANNMDAGLSEQLRGQI